MYRVCLMGAAFDTGNNGVSALAASSVKLILEARPGAEITCFIGNRSSASQEAEISGRRIPIKIANYRLSFRSPVRKHLLWLLLMACLMRLFPVDGARRFILKAAPTLKAVWEADFIGCIRGGDSFTDLYGLKRFIAGSLPSLITLILGKKLDLLPQTYGPFTSAFSKTIARYILIRSGTILSRDSKGLEVVREILGNGSGGKDIRFCPDVAFVLDASLPSTPEIRPVLSGNSQRPVIGFNISGLLFNGGYTGNNMFHLNLDYRTFVLRLAERFLKETDAVILFVPHTYAPRGHVENDVDACREVFEYLLPGYIGRVHLVTGKYEAHELKGIIGRCDYFIGSRMHACIAALSQGVPTTGVAYSRKFYGVFSSLGAGEAVVDARSAGMEEAVDAAYRQFVNRGELKRLLAGRADEMKKHLHSAFRDMLEKPS